MTEESHRHALARTRVVVSYTAGFIAFGVAKFLAVWQAAVLIGWSCASAIAVLWILIEVWGHDAEGTAAVARREDDSRVAADLLLVSSSVISLVAVGFGLVKAAHSKGLAQGGLTAIAVLTVVLSWAVVQCTYLLRYARLYYTMGGGVDFNEDDPPDYRDFAYLALTIGMTYQVSDTDLKTKAIRRNAMHHAVLSYLFGVVVVAMTINVVAGLLNR
jgi:uncharacterized membrane protein